MNDLFGNPSVEHGIPIPCSRVSNKRIEWNGLKDTFPFERMEIGSSFAIDPARHGATQIVAQNYVSGAAASHRKDHPDRAFTTRQMPDGTVRCWRIDPDQAKGRGE